MRRGPTAHREGYGGIDRTRESHGQHPDNRPAHHTGFPRRETRAAGLHRRGGRSLSRDRRRLSPSGIGHAHGPADPDRPGHDVQQGQGLRHAGGGGHPCQPRAHGAAPGQRTAALGLRSPGRSRQCRSPSCCAGGRSPLPRGGHQAAVRSAHCDPAHPEHSQGRRPVLQSGPAAGRGSRDWCL